MINNSNIVTTLTDNFIMVISKSFSDISEFDYQLIKFNDEINQGYRLILKYTVDKVNFLDGEPAPDITFYPVIFGEKIIHEKPNVGKLYIDMNINNELNIFKFSDVDYDDTCVEFQMIILGDVINLAPKWNYYDNMHQTLENWKRQIVSISEMYGHQMTYFKTDPTKTDETFQNNYVRDVVDIKKLLILVPNNNLPDDKVIYSEWDYAPVDEIYFDVVDYNFKHAFGDDNVPMQGDAVYFPLVNKYFRVTSVQPKNGFMGHIGWWNVYLTKYEDDESINFSDEMQDALSGSQFESEYTSMVEGGLIDHESILENTIEEKKEVNEAFTNTPIDSGNFVDLKETEILRSYINKRLSIVKLRPSTEAFPVTVYDMSTVERRNVGIVYELNQYNRVNKHSTTPENEFNVSLNLTTEKFAGEILDILTQDESIYLTLSYTRANELFFNFAGGVPILITSLTPGEYYQVNFNVKIGEIIFIIHKLSNGVKSLVYTQTFKAENINLTKLEKINIYGGKYYTNDLTLHVDNNKIMQDYCNPIFKHS